MKKLIPIMIVLNIMLMCSVALANLTTYPDYLNGDPNYILCDGHQGDGIYLKTDSIDIKLYNPPHYIIAFDVVHVPRAYDGNTEISHVEKREYKFEWNARKMFQKRKDGSWWYLNPNGSRADGAYRVRAGEIAFEIAYGIKFGAK